MSNCFNPANILLPNDGIDMEKWSVIACDQFTSQTDYWDAVEKYVGDAPSTLNVVFPEIYQYHYGYISHRWNLKASGGRWLCAC